MKKVRTSDVILGMVKVQAEMFHRARGDSRFRAARMYRMTETVDGSGAKEYMLTRYEDKLHTARSSLLLVEGDPERLQFTEICSARRKEEPKMIEKWLEKEGVQDVY